MPAARSRWIEVLTRTLLQLLAVAGLLAMLPSLPSLSEPGQARSASLPAITAAARR
jgi:hypothetical protein